MEKCNNDNIVLPGGWNMEDEPSNEDCVVLLPPNSLGCGAVTVNLKKRAFALGFGAFIFCCDSSAKYQGRGWKQRLIDDAVSHLKDVLS